MPIQSIRRVLSPVRVLVALAAILVTVAGTQLFALAEHTATFFAWTINPPVTAAFLGAAYWASLFLLIEVIAGTVWVHVRAGLVSVLVFTTLTLIVTLLHLDRFHFAAPEAIARVAAWAWLIVYVVTPPAFAFCFLAQLRAPGIDPPPVAPPPGALRVLFLLQTVIFLVFGIALLLAPVAAAAWWPWPLTPLTGRAIGAWLVAIGVAGLGVLVENDRPRSAGPAVSYAFLGLLELLAVLRFKGDLDWSHPIAWPYVVFWAVVALTGIWGATIARR